MTDTLIILSVMKEKNIFHIHTLGKGTNSKEKGTLVSNMLEHRKYEPWIEMIFYTYYIKVELSNI